MKRTLDAAFLNTVANHPDVRRWLGGFGVLDLSEIIANPANIALQCEHGGWVLVKQDAGTYDLHTLFMKSGRGRYYFEASGHCLDYLFTASDAREIVTRVPSLNRGAGFAADRCGFVERFARKNAWTGATGETCDVSYRALEIDHWVAMSAAVLPQGQWFHAEIEAAKVAFNSDLPDHPEDPSHDRAAGAAVMMIRAGNVRKGVWFYNRWARLAGYPPITLVSEFPVVIDIGAGVIVEVRHATMEVLQCP